MQVLCWGTYDTGKPRTRILREGLRAVGVPVRELHAALWEGVEDKSQVEGRPLRLRLALRWLLSYPGLLWRFLRAPRPDLVLVGFPGVLDVLLLAPFARLRGVPIAWDMFMSLYDTVALDRAMLKPASRRARLLFRLERRAIQRAQLVFLDTEAHARRVESLYGLRPGTCSAVWVGAEVGHFAPAVVGERAAGAPLRVLFYGQFIPLHGVETIVLAARLLAGEPVDWTLIGRGQDAGRVRRLLQEVPLPRLRWIEWVDYAELRHWIAGADVCLGVFGASDKAASVIPNKVFQVVAVGRPLITRDSPAIREMLEPAAPCVSLVAPADASALAAAVRELGRHLPAAGSPRCHAALLPRIDAPAIGRQFLRSVASRLSAVPGAAASADGSGWPRS